MTPQAAPRRADPPASPERSYLLLQGSARALPLRDESVQMCVTSPPYWGLRQYAGEQREVWGGDAAHSHEWAMSAPERVGRNDTDAATLARRAAAYGTGTGIGTIPPQEAIVRGGFCCCGAWYGALGLEPTPELYVEHIVAVFREVKRVLRRDGTLWLNLGDSYNGAGNNKPNTGILKTQAHHQDAMPRFERQYDAASTGLKPKDLVGIPWMVAFALRADGWYLRSDIIWAKPNPMPESVTDRPTKAHEYMFLLAKSQTYYYDADAIREEGAMRETFSQYHKPRPGIDSNGGNQGNGIGNPELTAFRNKRTVWNIATRPYPGAHFATYPEELVEPCILAGSAKGDVVLDPFNGSGTTGAVAVRLGRSYVGVDISREYLTEQALHRVDPLAGQAHNVRTTGEGQAVMPL